MNYIMKNVQYRMPETIADAEEAGRIRWLARNSLKSELRRTAVLLIEEWDSKSVQRSERQHEALGIDRRDIVEGIDYVIDVRRRGLRGKAFLKEATEGLMRLSGTAQSRYANEIIVMAMAVLDTAAGLPNPRLDESTMVTLVNEIRVKNYGKPALEAMPKKEGGK